MSLIEDIRKVIQDLVAPEIRAVSTRLDAKDKVDLARHEELVSKIQLVDQKVEYLVQDAISRINSTEQRLQAKFDSLISTLEIDKRLSRLEGAGGEGSGGGGSAGGGGSISESGAHRKAQPAKPKHGVEAEHHADAAQAASPVPDEATEVDAAAAAAEESPHRGKLRSAASGATTHPTG